MSAKRALLPIAAVLLSLAACDDQEPRQQIAHITNLNETQTIKDIQARLDHIEAIMRKSQLDAGH